MKRRKLGGTFLFGLFSALVLLLTHIGEAKAACIEGPELGCTLDIANYAASITRIREKFSNGFCIPDAHGDCTRVGFGGGFFFEPYVIKVRNGAGPELAHIFINPGDGLLAGQREPSISSALASYLYIYAITAPPPAGGAVGGAVAYVHVAPPPIDGLQDISYQNLFGAGQFEGAHAPWNRDANGREEWTVDVTGLDARLGDLQNAAIVDEERFQLSRRLLAESAVFLAEAMRLYPVQDRLTYAFADALNIAGAPAVLGDYPADQQAANVGLLERIPDLYVNGLTPPPPHITPALFAANRPWVRAFPSWVDITRSAFQGPDGNRTLVNPLLLLDTIWSYKGFVLWQAPAGRTPEDRALLDGQPHIRGASRMVTLDLRGRIFPWGPPFP